MIGGRGGVSGVDGRVEVGRGEVADVVLQVTVTMVLVWMRVVVIVNVRSVGG